MPADPALAALLATEAAYPIKLHLAQRVAELGPRLARAPEVMAAYGSWPDDRREKAQGTLAEIAWEFGVVVHALYTPLPQSTICICSRCRMVRFPDPFSGGWRCRPCFRLWHHHRASHFRPLPPGFWPAHQPGKAVRKGVMSDEQAEAARAPHEEGDAA